MQHLNAKYENKRRDSESLIGMSSYVAGIDFTSISVVIISRYHLHLAYPIYVPFRLLSATYDQTVRIRYWFIHRKVICTYTTDNFVSLSNCLILQNYSNQGFALYLSQICLPH